MLLVGGCFKYFIDGWVYGIRECVAVVGYSNFTKVWWVLLNEVLLEELNLMHVVWVLLLEVVVMHEVVGGGGGGYKDKSCNQ